MVAQKAEAGRLINLYVAEKSSGEHARGFFVGLRVKFYRRSRRTRKNGFTAAEPDPLALGCA